ncbi:hypothetical protein C798_00085 [Herbaspirillum rubrisubalbicans Os34]|uniref:DUF4935 domain-containing protein n=1 Tax=Herbaspirillum rubrisubalbicans Os34 TaxID=1235827 RepID=A0A6M3ZIU9_9BURK|nr:PIN domain-containing protein [Herbaspirillum rubrisubalbicans]QJP98683.1 hypothetical protein C798_00085 [Herbaspirillum rubrisubalbicans Os34]
MTTHVFVDTNVYLSLYHFSNDDVPSLAALKEKIEARQVVLHLPQQVVNEWYRNREVKLKAAAEDFSRTAFQVQIPRHMAGLAMAQQFTDAVAQAKRAREVLIAEATAAARTYSLAVDEAVLALFDNAESHAEDDDIFALARMRADKGNPPGKPGSVGDQYNWETLLAKVPDESDLYVISKDGDFASALRGHEASGLIQPNAYLRREWQTRKSADIYIIDSIRAFNTHHERVILIAEAAVEVAVQLEEAPRIVEPPLLEENTQLPAEDGLDAVLELAEDLPPFIEEGPAEQEPRDAVLSAEEREEKRLAVADLVNSLNFQATHRAISVLERFQDYFTSEDLNAMAEAAVNNSQIEWILSDDDVNQFYLRLVSRHIAEIEPDTVDRLIGRLDITLDGGIEQNEHPVV